MTDLRRLVELSQQLNPLAAQLVRKLLLSAPDITLHTRIALEHLLRAKAKGVPDISPAEMMALLEPKKHGVPRDRLVAHLEALHFLKACTHLAGTDPNADSRLAPTD